MTVHLINQSALYTMFKTFFWCIKNDKTFEIIIHWSLNSVLVFKGILLIEMLHTGILVPNRICEHFLDIKFHFHVLDQLRSKSKSLCRRVHSGIFLTNLTHSESSANSSKKRRYIACCGKLLEREGVLKYYFDIFVMA